MMKKIKNMKKNTVVSIAAVLVFAILLTSGAAVFNWSGAATQKATVKVKKPGTVKNLKKVKVKTYYDKKGDRNLSYAKITFKKVKGTTGYQILVYGTKVKGLLTPLFYEKTTKKTTYTLKNLIPGFKYTIKVRAYIKGKNGKLVYGKAKAIKIKMPGKMKGFYHTCNSCALVTSPMEDCICDHIDSVYKVHNELHAGSTYWQY